MGNQRTTFNPQFAERSPVFYCWQSDTPRRNGRDLIREALECAADTISKDASVPFRILVQSDTENEPGLCNIPETILRRLREADAVLSDLTFVAKTDAASVKHCSNPNVLFELGYAFAEVGPERLICVMNEVHGPTMNQIFDLAHHRRPISFRSPCEGSRVEAVKSLANSLEAALREIVKLGLIGGFGGDDDIMHERDHSEIESFWQSTGRRKSAEPYLTIWFRPMLYRSKRYADAEMMEALLRRIGPSPDGRHRYPPQPKGNAPMNWGLYNDTYGDPWTLTYAGQFWTAVFVGGYQPLTLSSRDVSVSPEPPDNDVIGEEQWVRADYALSQICIVFQLARNLGQQFGDGEIIQLGFEASQIRNRWLHFSNGASMGPCKAPGMQREIKTTVADCQRAR